MERWDGERVSNVKCRVKGCAAELLLYHYAAWSIDGNVGVGGDSEPMSGGQDSKVSVRCLWDVRYGNVR